MSLLDWFFKDKKPATKTHSSGEVRIHEATASAAQPAQAAPDKPPAPQGDAATRKSERAHRRELLYVVVRESMTRMGVLSSNYKFKVLSLDSRGNQYLIMMDLVRLQAKEISRLSEVEAAIAKSAQLQHGIIVTSVYWRVNDAIAPSAAHSATPRPDEDATIAISPPASKPRFEPLQEDEVQAFKRALSSMPAPEKLAAPGEIIHSGRRNPAPEQRFAETELDERPLPLSKTQYGDLN